MSLSDKNFKISILPCISENRFKRLMKFFNIDISSLNINIFLDDHPQKIGKKYLNSFRIFGITKENIKKFCINNFFFIVPNFHQKKILEKLKNIGINEDKIIYFKGAFL